MSAGAGVPLATAELLARRIVEELAPDCERIEIAGSIRRRREVCGDVELLAIPRLVEGPPMDLFGARGQLSALDGCLRLLEDAGRLVAHPTKPANGERYKRLWAAKAGVQVDLFLVRPPAEWGPLLAIRTGPAEYSAMLVTRLHRFGLRCEGGRVMRGDEHVPCPDEETFFRLTGVPFTAPELRGR